MPVKNEPDPGDEAASGGESDERVSAAEGAEVQERGEHAERADDVLSEAQGLIRYYTVKFK